MRFTHKIIIIFFICSCLLKAVSTHLEQRLRSFIIHYTSCILYVKAFNHPGHLRRRQLRLLYPFASDFDWVGQLAKLSSPATEVWSQLAAHSQHLIFTEAMALKAAGLGPVRSSAEGSSVLPSHLISKAMSSSQDVSNTSRSARQPCKAYFPTEENCMKHKAQRSASLKNEMSSFTQPHVAPNPCDFPPSGEHKRWLSSSKMKKMHHKSIIKMIQMTQRKEELKKLIKEK